MLSLPYSFYFTIDCTNKWNSNQKIVKWIFHFFVLFRRDGRLTHQTTPQIFLFLKIKFKMKKISFKIFLVLCVMAQQSAKKYPPNKKNIGHCLWCDLSDGGLWGVAAKVFFFFLERVPFFFWGFILTSCVTRHGINFAPVKTPEWITQALNIVQQHMEYNTLFFLGNHGFNYC